MRKFSLCFLVVVLLGLTSNLAADSGPEPLLMTKLIRDYKTFWRLVQESDRLTAEMNGLCQRVTKQNKLSIADEEQISSWFFGFLNVRRAFKGIAQRWDHILQTKKVSSAQKEKFLRVSFAALLEWYRASCFLVTGPAKVNMLGAKLNEAVPELGIPEGQLTKVMEAMGKVTFRDNLENSFFEIWKDFEQEKITDRPLQTRMRESFEITTKQAPNVWKMKALSWAKNLGEKIYKRYYQIESSISTWIGDTKYRKRNPSIHYPRVAEMTAMLKPGDILLERENWFLSNIFLPGFWKHGILYVGTAEDLKKLGLDKHPLVAPHLSEYSLPNHLGFPKRLLEAVSEGVIMNAMEEATDADYICAFRPRLSEEQIKQAIVSGFSHIGKPYDFCFDFQTADKIVCTELLYRSFRETLQLNLKKILGRWAYSADDLVSKFMVERNSPDRELDFLFFLDSDIKTQKTQFKDERALCDSIKRPSLELRLMAE